MNTSDYTLLSFFVLYFKISFFDSEIIEDVFVTDRQPTDANTKEATGTMLRHSMRRLAARAAAPSTLARGFGSSVAVTHDDGLPDLIITPLAAKARSHAGVVCAPPARDDCHPYRLTMTLSLLIS